MKSQKLKFKNVIRLDVIFIWDDLLMFFLSSSECKLRHTVRQMVLVYFLYSDITSGHPASYFTDVWSVFQTNLGFSRAYAWGQQPNRQVTCWAVIQELGSQSLLCYLIVDIKAACVLYLEPDRRWHQRWFTMQATCSFVLCFCSKSPLQTAPLILSRVFIVWGSGAIFRCT